MVGIQRARKLQHAHVLLLDSVRSILQHYGTNLPTAEEFRSLVAEAHAQAQAQKEADNGKRNKRPKTE